MLTVYGFGKVVPQVIGLTRDLRVLWALEECGMEYQVHGLDFFAGELKSADYLAVNPFGKVPAIDHDGLVLFESGAIVAYLAEQSDRLMPSGAADRARARQWAFAALNTVEPPLLDIAVIDLMHGDAEWAQERRPALVTMARDRLAVLDGVLAGQSYLLGDAFAYPDILMTTVLRQVRNAGLLEDYSNVTSYLGRCEARPAWRRSLAAYRERLGAPTEPELKRRA